MSALLGTGIAHFMELRGHRVIEACGLLWHSAGFGMYMSLPYRRRVDLDPAEARRVLLMNSILGVRYPSLVWNGLPGGIYVCRRRDYSVAVLHRTFRARVRSGLPCCEVRRVSETELLTQALGINRETMRRHQMYDPEFGDSKRWQRFVRAVEDSPSITPVGAFVDGKLASYAITSREDGWLELLYRMNSLQFDGLHPSHVLDFTITQQALLDPTIDAVSMGWTPLIPGEGLHTYKLHLGYDCEPQFSVIRLHPAFQGVLCSQLSFTAFGLVRRLWSHSQPVGMALAVIDGARRSRNGSGSQGPPDTAEESQPSSGQPLHSNSAPNSSVRSPSAVVLRR